MIFSFLQHFAIWPIEGSLENSIYVLHAPCMYAIVKVRIFFWTAVDSTETSVLKFQY